MNKKLKIDDNSFKSFEYSNDFSNDNYDLKYENDNYENVNLNNEFNGNLNNEIEQMINFGLPTSFGTKNKNKSKKKKSNQLANNQQFKLNNLNYDDQQYDNLNNNSNLSNNQFKLKNETNSKKFQKAIDKFASRKHLLFSKFAEIESNGIEIENDMLYSITPEKIAEEIAVYCRDKIDYTILIDGFCGIGGNLIQFALMNPNAFIIGIDNVPERILNAKKVAKLYGVEYQCDFICGNFIDSIKFLNVKPDIVFLSPPWGGINYKKIDFFPLSKMPVDGIEIFKIAEQFTNNISYYLPRNTDIEDIKQLNNKYTREEIEYNNGRNGFGKVANFYFGDLRDDFKDINVQIPLRKIDSNKLSKKNNELIKKEIDEESNYFYIIKKSIDANKCVIM